MFFKKKGPIHKIDKSFIQYDGFNEELALVKKGNRFIKPYEVTASSYEPNLPEQILDEHTELIYMDKKIYALYAVEADTAEEALPIFKKMESEKPIKALPILTWFQILSRFTGRDSLENIPEQAKYKKTAVLPLVLPYNVISKQKTISLSDETARTLLLTGFPSKIFAGFASELMELSDKLIVSAHFERMDIEKCLRGLSHMDARPARREVMRDFLTKEQEAGRSIYDTAFYIFYKGSEDEVDAFFKKLDLYLEKYLITKSDLDYQQKRAAISALPLCHNEIQYNRVFSTKDISSLIPISKLQDAKSAPSAVAYGKDIIQGDIRYSRLLNRESGAILSTDASWCVEKVKEEIATYRDHAPMIVLLADRDTDTSMFIQDGFHESEQELRLDDSSDFMKQALVARWAVNTVSVNGAISIRKMNALKVAIPTIRGEHYLEDFIGAIKDPDIRRTLALNPCPRKFYFTAYDDDKVGVLKVQGDRAIEREMGYALAFDYFDGDMMLYSLNSELLACEFPQFSPKSSVIYTLLVGTSKTPGFLSDGPTGNVDHVYDDPTVRKFIGNSDFLYVGEHKIAEKLKLNRANPMSKDQRDVITEPASGNLLITKEVSYILEA